ncbi:MAG: chemotaxis protein CheW [Nitrospirae bacterium]|nr:chemotaxis protein CheW [Nitrospirota bacterium]
MAKNLQFVVFKIGKELFGVGIDAIREIVRVPEVTEVPDAPHFLDGVINLRGRIVPVVDLRKRMGIQYADKTKATRVLITENSGSMVGLLVDAASEVIRIQPDAVDEPPEMISAIGVEYITGVAKLNERLIILLDIKKILNVGDMKKIAALQRPEPVQKAEPLQAA